MSVEMVSNKHLKSFLCTRPRLEKKKGGGVIWTSRYTHVDCSRFDPGEGSLDSISPYTEFNNAVRAIDPF